ncbi:MAG: aldo/keto reductase [Dehalococcoidales bacterium]
MEYRKFGKLDWEVSALGFGAMRLPTTGGPPASIDEPEAIRMIRHAIDQGVNYLDTAYAYHGGQSERLVGKALKNGYREKMRLTTKLPVRMVEKPEDFDRIFNEQMERLQTDKLDFYLLHGLRAETWRNVRDMGIIQWAEDKMAKGLFDYLGFSFHDEYSAFKEIVDDYDNWTLCQIQYNYMDEEFQAGRRGVEYAAGKGLAIIAMEPIRGGKLSLEPPEQVAKVWETGSVKRSPAEWALQWVWSQPEISLALSGMSKMEHVVENIAAAERSGPGAISTEDLSVIDKAREAFQGLIPVSCTNCGYCMPCPNGVEIPRIFQLYNDATMYNDLQTAKNRYSSDSPMGLKAEQRGDQCIECNECLDACPQTIAITDWLKKIHAELTPGE